MIRHIAISDDLTGANAVAILLKKKGLKVATHFEAILDFGKLDSCVFSTDTRGVEQSEAYTKIYNLVDTYKSIEGCFFSKRIDSTMRGNIGVEIKAMLDALGEEFVVVCTPAYPSAGRCVKRGELFVDGKKLVESDVVRDPKSKIHTSNIKEIIEEQINCPVYNFFEEDVEDAQGILGNQMGQIFKDGHKIIVCDATSMKHLENITKAIVECNLKVVVMDSGILTSMYVSEMLQRKQLISKKKILMVVGSINSAARLQIENLWNSQLKVAKILVETKALLSPEAKKCESNRVLQEVEMMKNQVDIVTVVSDGIYSENKMVITEEISVKINEEFASIADGIIKNNEEFGGLYTSGGDITLSIYRKMGVEGIEVEEEVLPLAVYGKLIGGIKPGFKVVTKGGSQGNSDAIEQCARYLIDKM